MESRRCCGSRSEIVWVDGFRFGSTVSWAFFQSKYAVESFFSQNALSAASLANLGMALSRLFINHALLPMHACGTPGLISDRRFACRSYRFSHRVQRRASKKTRSRLALFTSVSIHCAENPLRQRNVDSSCFIPKLADVYVNDRPSPAAKAPLAAQLFDSGRLWKG